MLVGHPYLSASINAAFLSYRHRPGLRPPMVRPTLLLSTVVAKSVSVSCKPRIYAHAAIGNGELSSKRGSVKLTRSLCSLLISDPACGRFIRPPGGGGPDHARKCGDPAQLVPARACARKTILTATPGLSNLAGTELRPTEPLYDAGIPTPVHYSPSHVPG